MPKFTTSVTCDKSKKGCYLVLGYIVGDLTMILYEVDMEIHSYASFVGFVCGLSEVPQFAASDWRCGLVGK